MAFNLSWLNSLSTRQEINNEHISYTNSIMETGKILRETRKKLGISRSDLAVKTKITTAVLEAIEKGWTEKLPEQAYLSSMLFILEDELKLGRNTLTGIMVGAKSSIREEPTKNFSLGNIEVFNSWQGNIIYILIMFVSIFIINTNQRKIAVSNSNTYYPIPSNISGENYVSLNLIKSNHINNFKSNKRKEKNIFRDYFPSLFLSKDEYILLRLKISKQTSLRIKSGSEQDMLINNANGIISLNVQNPVTIKADPPLNPNDQIIWGEQKYLPKENNNGIYILNNELNK